MNTDVRTPTKIDVASGAVEGPAALVARRGDGAAAAMATFHLAAACAGAAHDRRRVAARLVGRSGAAVPPRRGLSARFARSHRLRSPQSRRAGEPESRQRREVAG